MGQALKGTFDALSQAVSPEEKWTALTEGLAAIGLDQVNYAYLDMESFGRMDARGDPAMSTMRQDWLDHYTSNHYDLQDDVVRHVREGRSDPRFFRLSCDGDFGHRDIAEEARHAGLQAGLLTPLPGIGRDPRPTAGIVMGSSLSEAETASIVKTHGPQLIALGHLLHASLSREMLRRRANVAQLSAREKECLHLCAFGLRPGQIADRLMLADVTVRLHLKCARAKLSAKTLPEAVAKGLLFGQIEFP